MVLLVCDIVGIFQHLLCSSGTLQSTNVAHSILRWGFDFFQLWYLLLLLFFSCTIYPSLFINPAFFRNCWVCLPLPFLNWNVCENLCLGAKNLFWVFVQQVDNLKWCMKYKVRCGLGKVQWYYDFRFDCTVICASVFEMIYTEIR